MTLRRTGQFLVVLFAVLSLTGLSWLLPHSDSTSLLSPDVAYAGDPDAMEESNGPPSTPDDDDSQPPPEERSSEEEKSAESGSLWGFVVSLIESLF